MTIAEIISEIGSEIGRTDIDARITSWIQRAINRIYPVRSWSGLHKTYTFSLVASQRSYDLPGYFGKFESVSYDDGGGTGHRLSGIPLPTAEDLYHGSDTGGVPYVYWIKDNKIYLDPIPSGTETITIQLYAGSPNVFLHDINLTDDDGAASEEDLYLDEDAVSTGVGKLYFISPTTTDALIRVALTNNHVHIITVYHSADAATLGVPVYFDEDASIESERLLFVSPTNVNCAVQTNATKEHTHYVQFADDDNAATAGVAVYIEEDVVSQAERLRFISPGDINGTAELILTKDNGIPPFIEAFHELIYLKTLHYGQLWNRRYSEAREIANEYKAALFAAVMHDVDTMDVRPVTRGFGGESSANRRGEWWKQPGVKS